ncbi:tryptophan-rich sensory protein [Cryobacterium sp. PH31-O1]|uniref:tryptophan-rich sensory protein n=1 Tax=Cryobacterium sp. PH31-O1 TaxID=3046306 RepID=UPI0024B8D834|nr:tryptophan-rich sensory protein [Cryobacterium sp. PH31-O1]MDJ0339141.1 tryptophan-rich sensory protein [Cryobacterium sp. PH31-O1]
MSNSSTGRSDRLRQIVVISSATFAVIGSFVGSGAAGGTPITEASGGALAADATLIAPGGPAFAIWTPIYLGLVGYAVWQALPAQKADARQRRLGYPIALSLVLNAFWILSVQFDLLALSVPVIVALLVVLVGFFRLVLRSPPRNLVETILVDGTMGLYLGWVSVATAANIAAVLVTAGFTGFGLDRDIWGALVIALAGLVGIGLAAYGRGRWAPTAALAWGLAWVAVARLTGPALSTPTAVAAIVAVIVVVAVTIRARVRRDSHRSNPPDDTRKLETPHEL